jgi:hypothetical protein
VIYAFGFAFKTGCETRDCFTGRVGRTVPGYDSRAVSEGRRDEDSPFDLGACGVPGQLMPWSGEWAQASRVRGGLERSRESLEGAPSPRAWRRFARGGAEPSSEAEIGPRGHLPLEQDGSSPEGCRGWLLVGTLRLFGSWALLRPGL